MDLSYEEPKYASAKWAGTGAGPVCCLVLAVVVVGFLFLGGVVTAFRLEFGVFPPSRVNLVYWIDPTHPRCAKTERTYLAESVPFIGSGVEIEDICYVQ